MERYIFAKVFFTYSYYIYSKGGCFLSDAGMIGGIVKRQLEPIKSDLEYIKKQVDAIRTRVDGLNEQLKEIEATLKKVKVT